MRLSIDHRTRYSFSEPQLRVVQLLRMTPLDFSAQTITDWSIDINCDARLREGRDGYGNLTTMLYIDGPVEAVELDVRGEVLTEDHGGLVSGVPETLPANFFRRSTPLTQADETIEALAHKLTRNLTNDQAKGLSLAQFVFENIIPLEGVSPKTRTAAQTLGQAQGIGRDRTHLLLALAHASGLPARFVSGHCLNDHKPDSHRSAHCWTELHIEGIGWMAFDPSTGFNVTESYVRVAIGLDAGDATPLSGTRKGGGMEEMNVDVRVALSGAHGQ